MWSGTVGLINGQHKYLTAETFGHKINANGVALKKKQQWTIEPFPMVDAPTNGNTNGNGNANVYEETGELEHVAIKSHLGCYLAVDTYGNVNCEGQEISKGARFIITICSISNPQGEEQIFWAFKNVERNYYLGTSSDGMIACSAKMPQSREQLWHIHLVPARGATMFALKSIGRKRYAQAVQSDSVAADSKDGLVEQIQVDATSPWGSETLMQFKYFEGGRYALLTSTCKYLTTDGTCIQWTPNGKVVIEKSGASTTQAPGPSDLPPTECLFTIEYHGGFIAFRDVNGRYLAPAGRSSTLRTRSNTVSKDELFQFENAPIQIALRATFNNKWVSTKQGVDLTANQNEVTSKHETFNLEYDEKTAHWHFSTKDGNHWALGVASTIQAASKDEKKRAHFQIKWNEDGTCSILASADGTVPEGEMKWVCNRKSGQLYTGPVDPVKFYIVFQNRTAFNLRASTSSGFVGLKAQSSGKLEANRTSPDSLQVVYANSENDDEAPFNCCYFKMPANNKYWSVVEGNSVACDSSSPTCAQQWTMELRNGSAIAISTFDNGSYLTLTKQGGITVANMTPEEATLWEF